MTEFTLSYREIIPDQTALDNWKEITLTTGGTQSTLQDIKVAERANGFCYENSEKHYTRNRFIYWRINYDVLELVEHSLDINLTNNRVRYKFTDTPILDGVSIHETHTNIVILVPTVCSVHSLVFPHPERFHKQDELLGTHPDLAAPSIFSKASPVLARSPNTFYLFSSPSTAGDQLPCMASSYLSPDEDAFFVLAYPSKELLLIRHNPCSGQAAVTELKGDSSLMPRFLTGLAEKFRQRNTDGESIVSLMFFVSDYELYVVTLCREGRLMFWSSSKGQCVAIVDVAAETGDYSRDQIQSAMLRKAVDSTTTTDKLLAVFVNLSSGCQFHIFSIPEINGQQIKIHRIKTLLPPETDLIDFAIQSNRLWSLWRCEDGGTAAYCSSLSRGEGMSSGWAPVALEPPPDADRPPQAADGAGSDPRQLYLHHIFQPGRFPKHIITKALSIYKRSTVLSETPGSNAMLRQRICLAVENEIQSTLGGQVVNDDEYLEAAEWCWNKFYSCCVQYHIASLKPLGVMLLPSVLAAVFLKKSSFSFLRPVDPLEHMMLCSDDLYQDQFINFAMLSEDGETVSDVLKLFEVIVYLEQQMSESFFQAFEKELASLQMPDAVMESLLKKILLEMDSQFTSHILELLDKISDLYNAIHKVLELLRFDGASSMSSGEGEDEDLQVNQSAMHYFSSQLGISMVAGCLRQQAQVRFQICRNLLLICNIVLSEVRLELDVLEAVRSVCTPEIVVLTQAAYVMLWITGLSAQLNMPQEAALQRLTPLKLQPVALVRSSATGGSGPASLLEMFIASTAGHQARRAFARSPIVNAHPSELLAHWHLSLLPYLNHLRPAIWPISGGTVLAEWLLSTGQHLWLQQYVRLLSNWCEWNICTRSFLLAASFLTSGENYKAQDLFETAIKGVLTEPFLQQRILVGCEDDPNRAYINYYLKVIQLFELHKAKDCAINIANVALSIITPGDPIAATLYSIKFRHHLSLKHYTQAFDSLTSNPAEERRRDNLRELVKQLVEERRLDTLLSFTYGNMEDLFTGILLSRARAADPLTDADTFYNFLYSYQINRGPLNFRLAASVMYEQAFRLSTCNDQSVEALEKQVKCYLAAKNVLSLCSPEHAWVVRPTDPDEELLEVILPPRAGSNKDADVIKLKRQVEVVNIETIKKELLFADAKLKLCRYNMSSLASITSPVELVAMLNASGLFKTALEVCTAFQLSYCNVFETLTKHCVMLTVANGEYEEPNTWEWLVENDLQDLPMNRDNIADIVWKLLQDYLSKYEKPNMTQLHRAICGKIIQMGDFLPHWIVASYKLRNPAELLRMLHGAGRLEEAFELSRELLLAALGYGKEYFSFERPLSQAAAPFALPLHALRALLQELHIHNEMADQEKDQEPPFLKEYKLLGDLLGKYMETAVRATQQSSWGSSTMGQMKTTPLQIT
nr:unnamed protein product [Callosobruchus chinensis]